MRQFISTNPYTLQSIAEYKCHSLGEVQEKISFADNTFRTWKTSSTQRKSDCLIRLAEILRKNKANYAAIITAEMGKPITESLAEIEKCESTCQYYADNIDVLLARKAIQTEAHKTYITYQPLGIILGIMPWNFPFWQVFRFAIPTISAGNTVLLKHAPNVTGCGLAIEQAFKEAGFDGGVYQALIIENGLTESILQDFRVKGVSLTGSEKAGSAVASLAGKHLKKSVLELGGSDPFIVLKDADIQKAAQIGIQSRLQNAGQVCVSAKRFIVEETVKEEFVQAVLNLLPNWKPEDPMLPTTKMGPLARTDLAENIERQYRETLSQGATSLSNFYRENCLVYPMILDNVHSESIAFTEETFGPLIAISSVENETQAIELANKTSYGLGASIFSRDIEKAERLALEVNAGLVFVNGMVKSDPRFPIGGINNSGYGRELSYFGMHEFMNAKVLRIA